VTLTPAEIIAQAILTDRRLETDRQNARADASVAIGNAIAQKIEGDLLALFASLTSFMLLSLPTVIGNITPGKRTVFFIANTGSSTGTSILLLSSSSCFENRGKNSGESSTLSSSPLK
jgi:hypothetical protein